MENKLTQNQIEYLNDQIQQGKITSDQANVEMIKMSRFRLIKNSLPRNVRSVLNNAVKNKELGHLKKEGNKPEVYYHIDFRSMAIEARNEHERTVLNSLKRICV